MLKMEEYPQKENRLQRGRISDVYVPIWAQTLINLYTSDLRHEVMQEMRSKYFQ